MPSSPRGWLNWAVSVREWYASPRGGRYESVPHADWRTNDMRETSISIIWLLERSANGNGGARLTYEFFSEDRSWHSYLPHEQKIIADTAREFKKALVREGFLPDLRHGEEGDRGV